MKKLIFLFAILFSAKMVFGQGYKPVKIDSLVTISMPAGYIQKDTLGQRIYTATTDLGYIVTMVEPNAKSNQPLKKEKDLNNVLKTYISGIQRQSGNGSTQNVRDTTVGTLKARVFTLRTDDGTGNVQYRDFLLIYTKDATYTFQYDYPEMRAGMVKSEAKAYFSSIKLSPDLQRDDQYTDIHSKSSGVNTLSIVEIGGGIIVLCLAVWLIFFRNRGNELA